MNKLYEEVLIEISETVKENGAETVDLEPIYKKLHLDDEAAFEISKELDHQGYIHIPKSFKNKNYFDVKLTKSGKQEAKRIKDIKGGIPQFYLEDISKKSKQELKGLLKKLSTDGSDLSSLCPCIS